jgi:hypothetical protein
MSQTEALEKAAGMRISAGFDGLLATLIWAFDSVTKEAVVEMRRMRAQSEAILAAVVGHEIRGRRDAFLKFRVRRWSVILSYASHVFCIVR